MSSVRSSSGRQGRRLKNEINVVPYIDVMLVLLVIFMVTAPLITPGVIELPTVGQAASVPATPIEVQITEDGKLSWRQREANGKFQPVERSSLAQTILSVRTTGQPVVISADGKVAYKSVTEVMESLRKAGIDKLGLLVSQEGEITAKPARGGKR